ncbi:restriction endonuclease subunit S [Cohnella sp. LGH]|uniref:restriction endonuclease subunit S n=1 Tax=Cohnella sp. LGH TaxID=1619153 RepID=UPI001ADB3478|nr:restriction endonuclease subunit S [Cohnella sp. LGH]QTH41652.1 restriction endonuclease subunit S [Cohnella sp. LGH]
MIKWKFIKLRDTGTIITGNTPPTANREYYGNDYAFIKPTDIVEGVRHVENTEERFSIKGYERYRKSLLPVNTPCVVTIGSLGKKLCLTKEPSFTNQAINAIIMNKGNDGRFIYYMMKIMLPTVKHLSSGTASGRENVSKSSFGNIKINVPPLPVQQKIANILSVYDDLIENNNHRIELLEHAAQQIFKEWFVRFRFPGYENAHFTKGMPDVWEVKRLQEFGLIETGKTPPTVESDNYSGNIMFIKTPDMHGQAFVIDTDEKLTQKGHFTQPKKMLPANSICVSCIGTGGVVAINAEPAHTNQQINSIIPYDSNYLEWLYFTCKALKSTIEMFGATGATMTNLSKGKFEGLKVIFPGETLVYRFSKITAPMINKIKVLQLQNQNLTKQRDLLLQRLMSGKLEVLQ